MITIIDYGMGNLGSVHNMFKYIGVNTSITNSISEIEKAKKILLPGVGSFDKAISKIEELNLKAVLDYKALEEQIPILGICLGMQILTNSSEEGRLRGFGWIPGKTIKFISKDDKKIKIPHMGWNITTNRNESILTSDLPNDSRFYFVHSYYVKVVNRAHVILETHYGSRFDAAIQRENIFGAQFHPEKSHRFGMKFLENFSKI
jgi:imidazole glycerol-phosphate synthase subunit HisH